jgi:hypothetical protein
VASGTSSATSVSASFNVTTSSNGHTYRVDLSANNYTSWSGTSGALTVVNFYITGRTLVTFTSTRVRLSNVTYTGNPGGSTPTLVTYLSAYSSDVASATILTNSASGAMDVDSVIPSSSSGKYILLRCLASTGMWTPVYNVGTIP